MNPQLVASPLSIGRYGYWLYWPKATAECR
ncbi:hypothetical protein SAMN05421548_11069 [Paraburkholderia lycopersici]|uniref:Uncharacterized protein n=1 Tax=Paraburkholderia lycopersici TaxID=416944 RepID=A0A1G6P908_9BURK|nr:hypothetical protein SAMN05421548_11069 [Paraburkholderia lycopersici]